MRRDAATWPGEEGSRHQGLTRVYDACCCWMIEIAPLRSATANAMSSVFFSSRWARRRNHVFLVNAQRLHPPLLPLSLAVDHDRSPVHPAAEAHRLLPVRD